MGTKYNYHSLYIFYIFRHISIFPSIIVHVFIEAVDTQAASSEGGRQKPVKSSSPLSTHSVPHLFELASVVQPLKYIYIYIYIYIMYIYIYTDIYIYIYITEAGVAKAGVRAVAHLQEVVLASREQK